MNCKGRVGRLFIAPPDFEGDLDEDQIDFDTKAQVELLELLSDRLHPAGRCTAKAD